MKTTRYALATGLAIALHSAGSAAAGPAPSYTTDGQLLPPSDYREWIFLSSGIDMSYRESLMGPGHSMFDNVFVNPEAYRSFQKTGTWPDKTVLVTEARGASAKGSINKAGKFQSTDFMGLEIHVKDTTRFDGGWAFFGSDDGKQPASRIPVTESCYACHQAHGAVDTTFVQFYPTLLPIAQDKKTLSANYLKESAGAP